MDLGLSVFATGVEAVHSGGAPATSVALSGARPIASRAGLSRSRRGDPVALACPCAADLAATPPANGAPVGGCGSSFARLLLRTLEQRRHGAAPTNCRDPRSPGPANLPLRSPAARVHSQSPPRCGRSLRPSRPHPARGLSVLQICLRTRLPRPMRKLSSTQEGPPAALRRGLHPPSAWAQPYARWLARWQSLPALALRLRSLVLTSRALHGSIPRRRNMRARGKRLMCIRGAAFVPAARLRVLMQRQTHRWVLLQAGAPAVGR